jgi:hypothetical protein
MKGIIQFLLRNHATVGKHPHSEDQIRSLQYLVLGVSVRTATQKDQDDEAKWNNAHRPQKLLSGKESSKQNQTDGREPTSPSTKHILQIISHSATP